MKSGVVYPWSPSNQWNLHESYRCNCSQLTWEICTNFFHSMNFLNLHVFLKQQTIINKTVFIHIFVIRRFNKQRKRWPPQGGFNKNLLIPTLNIWIHHWEEKVLKTALLSRLVHCTGSNLYRYFRSLFSSQGFLRGMWVNSTVERNMKQELSSCTGEHFLLLAQRSVL